MDKRGSPLHRGVEEAGLCQDKEDSFLVPGEMAEFMDTDPVHWQVWQGEDDDILLCFSMKSGARLSGENHLYLYII